MTLLSSKGVPEPFTEKGLIEKFKTLWHGVSIEENQNLKRQTWKLKRSFFHR
jgi:hypothetical protein